VQNGKPRKLGNDGGRLRSSAAARSTQYTGTIDDWYEETCITYANMQINDITGHYAENSTIHKGSSEAYHHNNHRHKSYS